MSKPRDNDPIYERLEKPFQQGLRILQYPRDLGMDGQGHYIMFFIYETDGIELDKTVQKINERIVIEGGQAAEQIQDRVQNLRNLGTTGLNFFLNQQTNQKPQSDDPRSVEAETDPNRQNRSDRLFTRQSTALNRGKKKLKDAVALYMPEQIGTAYGFDYAAESLGTAAMVGQILQALGSRNANVALAGDLMQKLGTNFGARSLDAIAGIIGQNTNATSMLQAFTRRVENPFMEFIFQAVNQRTFEYTFNFTPRSEEEAKVTRDIIQTFKYHAHPELNNTGVYLNFPSEFDIVYFHRDSENLFLNRMLSCALTGITVNYSGAGLFSTFGETQYKAGDLPNRDDEFLDDTSNGESTDPRMVKGAPPTHTSVTLTFSELGLLDRDVVKQGF